MRDWDASDMQKAVEAVRRKEMGYKKAADTYKVPRTTLFR